ncbi:putative beta-lysine N-acetyltransferase [Desulfotomaculum sp. 1211_IL3151]|uniref:putative beta-lysine N-acetyltransferase n=1 Tax=Desulfotomaculum sp. 1211_IL3151 TaxID=3084055 RepID=UPI002FD91464
MPIITINRPEFFLQANLDEYNRRIWIQDYRVNNATALRFFLLDLAKVQNLEKIIFPVKEADLHLLRGEEFRLEGVIKGYFQGADAYFLTFYLSEKRCRSGSLLQEKQLLEKILGQPREYQSVLPKGFSLKLATGEHTKDMAELFNTVFSSYPTPVYDPSYLREAIQTGDIYVVCYEDHTLAGVSTAEIDWNQRHAELTNCATHPDYRGMGLNTILLKRLEENCRTKGIHCLFSLSRASSYGMNLVLHRLGYEVQGRLINNCHIAGDYENMNIWVKPTLNSYKYLYQNALAK